MDYLYTLLDTLGSGLITTDSGGRIISMNKLAETLTGFSSGEAHGTYLQNIYKIEHPVTESNNTGFEGVVLNGHNYYGSEKKARLLNKDGTEYQILSNSVLLKENEADCIAVVFRDVTDSDGLGEIAAEEKIRINHRQTELLQHYIKMLNRASSPEQVFEKATDAFMHILGADGTVLCICPDDGEAEFKAARNLTSRKIEVLGQCFPWKKTDQDLKPLLYPDSSEFDFGDEITEALRNEGITALAFIPLKGSGFLSGWFAICFNKPHEFSNHELNLALVLSENLAIVIQRWQALEDAKQTALKYKSIFINSAEGIYQSTPEGRFITVNPAMVRMFGFEDTDDMLAFPDTRLLYWDENERERLESLVDESGHIHNVELKMKRIDGSALWVLMNDRSVYDNEGKLIFYEGTLLDITERKLTQEALKESEEMFRNFVETSVDLVVRIDKHGIAEYISPRVEEFYGYKTGELIGKHFGYAASPDEVPGAMGRFESILKGEPIKNFEIFLVDRSGLRVPMEINAVPFYRDGEVAGMQGIIRDISERRKAEAERQAVIQRRQKETEAIVAFARSPHLVEGDLNKFAVQLTEIVTRILEIGRAAVWVFTDDGKVLVNIDTYTASQGHHFIDEAFMAGEIMSETEYLFKSAFVDSSDPGNDPRFSVDGKARLRTNNILAKLDAAIRTGDRVLGMICFEHVDKIHTWTEDEITFACQCADQMALAIAIKEKLISDEKANILAEFNQNIVASAPVGILTVDINGKLTSANEAFLKMVGSPGLEMSLDLGMNIPSVNSSMLKDAFLKTLSTGKPFIIDRMPYYSHWGKYLTVNIKGVPQKDRKGNINGIIIVAEDVSSDVRNEKIQNVLYNILCEVHNIPKLENLIEFIRQELSSLIYAANFYIALYDEKRKEISLPYFINERDDLSEYQEDRSLTEYVIRMKKPLLADAIKIKELEECGETEKCGSEILSWLGLPLLVKGKVIGAMVVQSYKREHSFDENDVHMLELVSGQIGVTIERKIAEEELLTALARAQESDRLKTAFLGNLSHEIRTPLNGIIGIANLIQDMTVTSEERKQFSSMIHNSSQRLLDTINNLIDISKIEAGQVIVNIAAFSINKLLEELYWSYIAAAEVKGLLLVPPDAPALNEMIIRSDRYLLHSVLSNLIKNALKYTSNGKISFGYKCSNQIIQFFVADTGIGIPEEKQKMIFDRFVQAETEDSRTFEGSGLGLSIAKGYIGLLNGAMWLSSEPGKGSTFFFSIPVLS